MKPVDTGLPHPIDGGQRNTRMSGLIVVVAVAVFLGCGMVFYSLVSSPSTSIATDFSSDSR